MAKNFNQIYESVYTTGNSMSFGNAMLRGNGIPLDITEVYDSYDKAVKYAATNAVAYEGQILAVTENGDTTAYIITPKVQGTHSITEVDPKTEEEVTTEYNVCIKPIGIIPTGDGKTISVTEDGVISLLAADTQVDEKNEDGEATGNKVINAGAQLVLQSDGTIKWVQPDTSTAEGQAQEIANLKGRMDDAEGRIGLPEDPANEGKPSGLYELIADEIKRATEAETALGERIDDVNTALADYAKTADVNKTLEDYAKTADVTETLKDYATTANVNKALEDYTTTAGMEVELAKKADKSAYDQTVIDLDALAAKVDAFLTGTGTEEALDSLKELIAYIDEHDGADLTEMIATIQSIQNKLTLGTYVDGEETKEYATVKAYVEAAIAALKIGDYAKAADLAELAGKVTTLEGKVDVDKVSEAIAAAKSGAETTAKGYADTAEENAKKYADDELAKKADADKFVSNETFESFKTTNEQVIAGARTGAVEDVAKVGYALAANVVSNDTFNSFKEENTVVINGVSGRVETVENKLKDIEDKAEVNAIEVVKVEGTALTIDEDRTVNITREKLNVYSKSETDSAVRVAKDAADAAQKTASDAALAASGAQGTADEALALAQANGLELQTVENEMFGYEVEESDGSKVFVDGLVQKTANHAERIGTLEGQVQGDNGLIAKIDDVINNKLPSKANQSSLNDTNDRVGALEELVGHDKKVDGETTIEATGLVKKTADNAAAIVALDTRLTKEEAKVDNDHTYSFIHNNDGDFSDVPVGGFGIVCRNNGEVVYTEIYDTGIKDYVDPKFNTIEGDVSTLKTQIGGLSGAMHFKGVVNTDPTATSFNTDGYEVGDVVIYGNKEFVLAEIEEQVSDDPIIINTVKKFVEFGDATGNASAISELSGKVTKLETKVDLADNETVTGIVDAAEQNAKDYADSLAGNYATAAQGEKADSAIQTVAAGTGLKATVDATDATKVTIDIDEAVTFILRGGSATGFTTTTTENN